MYYSYLVALTHYVEGREEEYNDWYTWVHLRDVMRHGVGVIAAQRFRQSDVMEPTGNYTQPYLCFYEVSEPLLMTNAHAPVFTDEMPISDAYTTDDGSEVYFDEIAGFNKQPGVYGQGNVILERIAPQACTSEVAEWYIGERFEEVRQLTGIVAGSVGVPNEHQMFEQELSGLFAIYWTQDLAHLARKWPALTGASTPAGLDHSAVSLGSYTPVMERLTMEQVCNASDDDRLMVQSQRERLGDRVLTGPPADIKTNMFD